MKLFSRIHYLFSDRQGGVSLPPFDSFNLGFHVGDNPDHVVANHQLLLKEFPQSKNLKIMNQIHSDQVCHVDSLSPIQSCDALITQEKGVVLVVMVADCIPILLYDPIQEVVAAVHAGRAGAFENIIQKTLDQMASNYESQIADIEVFMGPSIMGCCYEVGENVAQEAVEKGLDDAIEKRENSYFLDIRKIVKKQLYSAGVPSNHLLSLEDCTACHTDRYFSYRKEGQTGRFCGAIMLK